MLVTFQAKYNNINTMALLANWLSALLGVFAIEKNYRMDFEILLTQHYKQAPDLLQFPTTVHK